MTTGTHAIDVNRLLTGIDPLTLAMLYRSAKRRIESAPERFAAESEHLSNLEVSLAEFCAAYTEMSRQFEDLFASLQASAIAAKVG